jgi:hypothetical protein
LEPVWKAIPHGCEENGVAAAPTVGATKEQSKAIREESFDTASNFEARGERARARISSTDRPSAPAAVTPDGEGGLQPLNTDAVLHDIARRQGFDLTTLTNEVARRQGFDLTTLTNEVDPDDDIPF